MKIVFCFSARELALEDRQSWLQQQLRDRMAVDGEERVHVCELT